MTGYIPNVSSAHLDGHQRLVHVISVLSTQLEGLVDCKEKEIYLEAIDFLLELQTITSLELNNEEN
jgi:hypothetical protein